MNKPSIRADIGPADDVRSRWKNDGIEDVAQPRRAFFGGLAAGAAAVAVGFAPGEARAQDSGRSANVRDHGAVGDGQADDSDALQRAIDHGAAHAHPVFFPPGTYRTTRSLRLRDEVDLFGTDASFCVIRHDLRHTSASHRRDNHACIRIQNDGDPPGGAKNLTIRHLRFTTSEPRADFGDEAHEQTAIYAKHAFWNCRFRELMIEDFAIGIDLQDCWTARIQYCAVIRAQVHCLRWENATAGEITGNRFDCISGSVVSGRGRANTLVSFSTSPPNFYETICLGVTNNSFQAAEGAGFHGVGLSNMTFTNNFLENNNRANRSAALFLETAPRPVGPPGPERRRDRHPLMRVVNINGGFVTPGGYGHGPAVKIGDYFVINIMGLDLRGARLRQGLHLYGRNSQVNIIGMMSRLENVIRSPHRHIVGSVMRVRDA